MFLWACFVLQNLCFVKGNFWKVIPFLKLISFIYSEMPGSLQQVTKLDWITFVKTLEDSVEYFGALAAAGCVAVAGGLHFQSLLAAMTFIPL